MFLPSFALCHSLLQHSLAMFWMVFSKPAADTCRPEAMHLFASQPSMSICRQYPLPSTSMGAGTYRTVMKISVSSSFFRSWTISHNKYWAAYFGALGRLRYCLVLLKDVQSMNAFSQEPLVEASIARPYGLRITQLQIPLKSYHSILTDGDTL